MKTPIKAYEETLIELAEKTNIIVLTTEPLKEFTKKHPNKIIKTITPNIGTAIGLAKEGKTPIIHTNASTNWKQIHEISKRKLDIKIIDTQEQQEDIALAKTIPELTIIVPADYNETKKATTATILTKGTVYLRLEKHDKQITKPDTQFIIGRIEIVKAGKDATIIATGQTLTDALAAHEKLTKQEIDCTILNCHTIQPIDKHAIIASAKITGSIVTIEKTQGLGTTIAEIIAQTTPTPMRILTATKDTPNEIIRAIKETILHKIETTIPIMPEQTGKKLYYETHPELYFRLYQGGQIKNLPELKKALIEMTDKTFKHHCNENKNEFCIWIKEALNEPALAKNIEKTHNKLKMALEITKWIE